MRSPEKRPKRSRSHQTDSENEDNVLERRRRSFHHTRTPYSEEKNSTSSILTLSLIAALGISVFSTTDLVSTMNDYNTDNTNLDNVMAPMEFPYKPRPQRLRYRDDLSMMKYSIQKQWNGFNQDDPVIMMPLVTERPRSNHLLPRMSPTTSTSSNQDPSLEDIELIDVLWRSDIAAEKGQRQFAPSDQYERDLQLLTEKSIREPLTTSEASRYEDLAKGFFEDFFFPNCKTDCVPLPEPVELRREVSTPTDEDLDALLEDVTKEGGQLDQLCPSSLFEPEGPLINNVSLSQGIIFDTNNITELHTYEVSSCSPVIPDGELFSNGTLDSPTWPSQRNLAPGDIFPTGPNDTVFNIFNNESSVPILSNGVHYNHSYTSSQQNNEIYDNSYYVPNGMSNYNNESSSVCSSSTSRSPNYLSEAENMPPVSRYYGKLAPNQPEYTKEEISEDAENSSAPRRRGRQSKDEQLAKMNHLPLSAKEIAEMSLADLQKMLKSDSLTEQQKSLIKKIRRRGKNKVAARTCRQRRGDRIAKGSDTWTPVDA